MAYTTITKHTDYFNNKLYTGDGGTQSVTGVGFQPDFTWLKCRSTAYHNRLFDAVRGAGKNLISDTTNAEQTVDEGVTAFNSDGFSVKQGSTMEYNKTSETYASWNWKGANGTASNSNGTITSTVSANTTAGFSIVSYTANGTQGATVGHGLSSAPEMVITKDRSATGGWGVYHIRLDQSSPEDKYIELNSNSAVSDFTYWNDTKPSNTVVTIGNAAANNTNGRNIIMYCFHSVTGYSKFGSYTGNGNADGPFIYTGFKPAFVIIKGAVSGDGDAAQNWELYDNKRLGYNVDNNSLLPSTAGTENTGDRVDILSNGFKIRINSDGVNDNNSTYIYMAIGQSLVGTNNTPCTAR